MRIYLNKTKNFIDSQNQWKLQRLLEICAKISSKVCFSIHSGARICLRNVILIFCQQFHLLFDTSRSSCSNGPSCSSDPSCCSNPGSIRKLLQFSGNVGFLIFPNVASATFFFHVQYCINVGSEHVYPGFYY